MSDSEIPLDGDNSEKLPSEIYADGNKECPSCLFVQIYENKFCEKCGQNFSGSIKKSQSRVRSNLKDAAVKIDKRSAPLFMRDARVFILVIALITIGYYCYLFQTNRPIDQLNAMPLILNLVFMVIPSYLFAFLVTVFFILLVWSFKNHFSALVVCFAFYFIETWLVLYMGGWVSLPFVLFKLFVTFLFFGAIKMQIKLKNSEIKI